MKFNASLMALAVLVVGGCSTGPSEPASVRPEKSLLTVEGAVSSSVIATERIRLRRVGGGDIRTGLVNGQVIDVPLNVRLDVWAEITRLEADRARLLVNWGNGNVDFTGCGSCRLENTYTQPGRYTLAVSIIDLNAAAGTAPIASVVVTLNVFDFAALTCAPVTIDFESFSPGTVPPYAVPGVTISAASGEIFNLINLYTPTLDGYAFLPGAPVTMAFASDKNSFSMGVAGLLGPTIVYQALNANGAVVASGSFIPSVSVAPGVTKGVLAIDGPTFRTLVLTSSATQGQLGYDNISARCQ